MEEGKETGIPVEQIKKPRKKERLERAWLKVKEVAKATGYSAVRIRHLAKDRKIPFKKVEREEGKRGGSWSYVVRIGDVIEYRKKLPSFSEMGSWPSKTGWERGRPKGRLMKKRGVIFQAS